MSLSNFILFVIINMLKVYPLFFKNVPDVDKQIINNELYKQLKEHNILQIVVSIPYCTILTKGLNSEKTIPYGNHSGIFINNVEIERVNWPSF